MRGGEGVFHSDHQGAQKLNRCWPHGAEFLEEHRRQTESAKVLKALGSQRKFRAELVLGAVGTLFGGDFCPTVPSLPTSIGRWAS
jgi:hypothetical protein